MRLIYTFLFAAAVTLQASAQQTLSTQQAKDITSTYGITRSGVHDPSIVYDSIARKYYLFGTHRGKAVTTNLKSFTQLGSFSFADSMGKEVTPEKAFVKPAITTITKAGKTVALPAFNATEWAATASGSSYDVNGNMWAPDVIYNKAMHKWCMYLSINGANWGSSIIMLTADSLNGRFTYQAPIVVSGFNGTNANDYKLTDLPIVLGSSASLPARYKKGEQWGTTWPNNIDPCVFYDESGQLWLTYGSWSGGIWILKLNASNGLRDYDTTYALTGSGNNYTSDPYFGTKIAGGYYVSGEGSYVHHIGNYYYLFLSYGFLTSNGGYEMRVFRSAKPNGPYVDQAGNSAVYTSYQINYGPNATTNRGEKIMGAYNDWGFEVTGDNGEIAQGHNSVITTPDNQVLLVYHTRFHNRGEAFENRVHQLFLNQQGWLVAAPFEYSGETVTNDSVSSKQLFADSTLVGTYKMLVHAYRLNYEQKQQITPVSITLNADGTITGDATGKWQTVSGTSYINITLGSTPYRGVVIPQQMEPTHVQAICFTAMAPTGVNIWGYKIQDQSKLALQVAKQDVPVKNGSVIKKNVNLYGIDLDYGVDINWQSSKPELISYDGKYNASAVSQRQNATLTLTETAGDWQWSEAYNVSLSPLVLSKQAKLDSALVACYTFDGGEPYQNSMDPLQTATLCSEGTNSKPLAQQDHERTGEFLHTAFGANGNSSYVALPNALKDAALSDGMSIAFWLKRADDNVWDDIFGFTNASATVRWYFTGNAYMGYNGGNGNYADINYPSDTLTHLLPVNKWTYVIVTLDRSKGLHLYVDGTSVTPVITIKGTLNDESLTTATLSDVYPLVLSLISSSDSLYLGHGSFWGSAEASYDDVSLYARPITAVEARNLYALEQTTASAASTGIEQIAVPERPATSGAWYNLQGQRIMTPARGIYIHQGKKIVIK